MNLPFDEGELRDALAGAVKKVDVPAQRRALHHSEAMAALENGAERSNVRHIGRPRLNRVVAGLSVAAASALVLGVVASAQSGRDTRVAIQASTPPVVTTSIAATTAAAITSGSTSQSS